MKRREELTGARLIENGMEVSDNPVREVGKKSQVGGMITKTNYSIMKCHIS